MSTIVKSFGTGGANLTPAGSSGEPSLAQALRDIADDFEEIRDQFILLLQKLDLDGGVTDTDYEGTLTPAALLTIKG